ncbi:hypothetical protein evm_014309 [Chilo suppressalis]|nr:hypothetical protein evm_014309 [Chilo suppressalis]
MSALSRKRRILDLALNLDNNDNDDSTTNRNTHDENSNLDPYDTAMSSPHCRQEHAILKKTWQKFNDRRTKTEMLHDALDYIKDSCTERAKEFRFWSDNCAGQNRNRFAFSVYLFAAKKYKVSITYRFLEKGHTQNEGDHSKTIYTPDEWHLLVRWAKTEGEPY